MFKRLDRYVLRQVIGPLALALAALLLVLLVNALFILARETIEKRVPVSLVAGFLFSRMPQLLLLSLPAAGLIGVLVGVGRLASQHELTALQASGVSAARVFRPIFVLAILLAIGALYVSHFAKPYGEIHRRTLVQEILRSRDLSREIDPGVFYDRLPGSVLYAKSAGDAEGQGRVLEGVLLYQEQAGEDGVWATLIVAQRGRAVFDAETGRISLLLDRGERHIWQPERPADYSVVNFPQLSLTFPPDQVFQALSAGGRRNDHRDSVGLELVQYIQRLRRDVALLDEPSQRLPYLNRIRKARLEWHERWSFPMALLVLMITGFPLASRIERGGRFTGLSQGMVILIGFTLLLRFGLGLSESGSWPIWIGPWLPHLLCLPWAAWLWIQLRRGRRPVGGPLSVLGGLIERLVRPLFGSASRGLLPRRRTSTESGRRRGRQRERWVGFTRLDTYLSSGHIKMLALALAIELLLVAGLEVQEGIDAIPDVSRGIAWSDLFAYVGLSLPGYLRFMLPIASLFAAMISLARLAHGNEIISMKAAGIGPSRIALPLVLVTLAVAGLYALAQESVVPASQRESDRAYDRLRGLPSASSFESGRRWVLGDEGHLWSYLGWDDRESRIISPWFAAVDFENATVLERLAGQAATRQKGESWVFRDGWRRAFSAFATPTFARFERRATQLGEAPALFGETRRRSVFGGKAADQMSFRELREHLARVSRSGYDATALEVGLNEKAAQPLLAPLLVLFGVPLVVGGTARGGSRYGFGLALLVSFVFWAVWAVTTALGREGVISPPVAVWLPPILLAACAMLLLARAR